MFQHGNSTFDDRTKPVFRQVSVGPAQAMQQCVEALRRGDRSVVLTSALRTERRSLLSEIGRLLGRGYSRVLHVDGEFDGERIMEMLDDLSVDGHSDHTSRHLVIIDNAEMLETATLHQLGERRATGGGYPVQFLLSGAELLISNLCDPASSALWEGTSLAVVLQPIEPGDLDDAGSVDQLRSAIARAESRLAAQKRMLAIFESRRGRRKSPAEQESDELA